MFSSDFSNGFVGIRDFKSLYEAYDISEDVLIRGDKFLNTMNFVVP